MASESSSAVLALNDADDDTEAPSVTDDAVEGAPLIMEHGADIAVKVDSPMKQLSTLETFVSYRVRCVCARWPATAAVRRRYNHFKALHKRLSSSHPLIAVPPLPPLHSARQQLDRYSPAFVAVRTLALHAFLERIAKHPILTHSEDFRIFLTTPDDQFEKVFKNESSALNLWGLSSAFYTDPKPDGARVKDPEFTAIADYLQSVQHKLTTLCTLTTKLCKGTTQLGTEWERMTRHSAAWSTQAGGLTARAAGALSAGAAASQAARQRPARAERALALLPLLAAYAAAIGDKIRQRDNVHSAHVAGNNSDELHNKLEQASEALRADLADWTPKTAADVKGLLLELADRQVNIHSQTLMGWEHALKLSSASVEDIFKTVSKTAVQNLSPSKCRTELTPTETERDLDEFDDYSNDSDIDKPDLVQDGGLFQDGSSIKDGGLIQDGGLFQDGSSIKDGGLIQDGSSIKDGLIQDGSSNKDGGLIQDGGSIQDGGKVSENKVVNGNKSVKDLNGSDVNLRDLKLESLDSNTESSESKKSGSKPMSDPLHDFAEIDLSS